MPSYDYRCAANDRVVEVRHRMSEKLTTWGEVCTRAGIDAGDTAADAPVERLINRRRDFAATVGSLVDIDDRRRQGRLGVSVSAREPRTSVL